MNLDTVFESLKSQKIRITPIREAMVEFFYTSRKPHTFAQISDFLQQNNIFANKTTIYRELDFLKRKAIIVELDFGEGMKRYELLRDHHHHAICTQCESVEDVYVQASLKREEQRIAEKLNFRVDHHSLEFFGVCRGCQKSGSSRPTTQ